MQHSNQCRKKWRLQLINRPSAWDLKSLCQHPANSVRWNDKNKEELLQRIKYPQNAIPFFKVEFVQTRGGEQGRGGGGREHIQNTVGKPINNPWLHVGHPCSPCCRTSREGNHLTPRDNKQGVAAPPSCPIMQTICVYALFYSIHYSWCSRFYHHPGINTQTQTPRSFPWYACLLLLLLHMQKPFVCVKSWGVYHRMVLHTFCSFLLFSRGGGGGARKGAFYTSDLQQWFLVYWLSLQRL